MANCTEPKAGCCSRSFRCGIKAATLVAGFVFSTRALAEDSSVLADLSIEELAELRVVSVGKSALAVSEAPASVFVITETNIHRAGSTTLPEALRLAPNLEVARFDARRYAISSRGFNNVLANKLLVMIDGRTVYSPLFSGVFWDAQDVVMEDLDRIEVLSGAGGAVWGTNAVNGVINIITRSAAETQGHLLSLGAGNRERHGAWRYGGRLGGGHHRVYAKSDWHEDTSPPSAGPSESGWTRSQAGFRMDWDDDEAPLTIQGDVYSGRINQALGADVEIEGANILARKRWELTPDSRITVQTYIDHTRREDPGNFEEHLNTFDLDLEHAWRPAEAHKIVWGGGYRYARDKVDNGPPFSFLPERLNMIWRNLFVEDTVTVMDELRVTLGLKVEDNPYTDWESMPSVRLSWSPDRNHLVWSGLSRALRSPSRIDRDFFSPTDPPVVNGEPQYRIAGGPDFESEIADVFEVGYRAQPHPDLSWSVTAFHTEYDKLRTLEPNASGAGVVVDNLAEGSGTGLETWGSWQARPNWRLQAGFVAQDIEISLKPGSLDVAGTTAAFASDDPELYGHLRSSYDLSPQLAFDATLRYVSELDAQQVPAYSSLDLRLAWKVTPNLELSLVGQNLLDESHPEFGQAPERHEFERGVYGKLVWTPSR